MLSQLLELLKDDSPHSLGDLAAALDTTVEMVEAMLERLAQMGYVRQVDGCDQSCASCPSAGHCLPIRSGRIWTLVK
jgi:predicted ArsR family transcriptional regulator